MPNRFDCFLLVGNAFVLGMATADPQPILVWEWPFIACAAVYLLGWAATMTFTKFAEEPSDAQG